MINPTVGRIVWFYDRAAALAGNLPDPDGQPMAALVTHVWHDRMVNLAVFDANGQSFNRTSVSLHQDGDPAPAFSYCEWMPFQKGQAAKAGP